MFYIQHGFGKSTKIEEVSDDGHVGGLTLSPAHEDPSSLAATAARCQELGLDVLVDPQSYVYSLNPQGAGRHHEAHEIDFTNLHWAPTAVTISAHLEAVRSLNESCGTSELMIAPSPFQTSLMDYWMPTAIQYARTASEVWGSEHTLASIVIDENVLTDWSHIQDWLDVLTTLNVRGFYLLVNRNRATNPPTAWSTKGLSNLLRVIYTLAELNDYELHWGYSDFDGLLGLAVGATSASSGWSYGHRQFSVARWNEVRTGGAPAVPRVTIAKLMASVRFNEAEDISDTPVWRDATSKEVRDFFGDRSFGSLRSPQAQVQHLRVIAQRATRMGALADIPERLDLLEGDISDALTLFTRIEKAGLTLDPRYSGRLRTYRDAISEFRSAEIL